MHTLSTWFSLMWWGKYVVFKDSESYFWGLMSRLTLEHSNLSTLMNWFMKSFSRVKRAHKHNTCQFFSLSLWLTHVTTCWAALYFCPCLVLVSIHVAPLNNSLMAVPWFKKLSSTWTIGAKREVSQVFLEHSNCFTKPQGFTTAWEAVYTWAVKTFLPSEMHLSKQSRRAVMDNRLSEWEWGCWLEGTRAKLPPRGSVGVNVEEMGGRNRLLWSAEALLRNAADILTGRWEWRDGWMGMDGGREGGERSTTATCEVCDWHLDRSGSVPALSLHR